MHITEIQVSKKQRKISFLFNNETLVFQPFANEVIGTEIPEMLFKTNELYQQIRKKCESLDYFVLHRESIVPQPSQIKLAVKELKQFLNKSI